MSCVLDGHVFGWVKNFNILKNIIKLVSKLPMYDGIDTTYLVSKYPSTCDEIYSLIIQQVLLVEGRDHALLGNTKEIILKKKKP
jgi:hypothetical protein